MSNGQSWSAMAVISVATWTVVAGLMVGMWISLGAGNDPLAQAFGFTGCATSAVAAVLTIRRYACRVMGLIRALHGLEEVEAAEMRGSVSAELRSLHGVP